MKINNFQSELIDISAKKEAHCCRRPPPVQGMLNVCVSMYTYMHVTITKQRMTQILNSRDLGVQGTAAP